MVTSRETESQGSAESCKSIIVSHLLNLASQSFYSQVLF